MTVRALLLLLLFTTASGARAACTVSTTAGAFGSVSSFTVNSTEQATSANLLVQCDVVLGLLNNDTVTLTYTGATVSAGTRASLKRTDNTAVADVVPVRLCGQSGCASNSEVAIGSSYTEREYTISAVRFHPLYSAALLSYQHWTERQRRTVSGNAQFQCLLQHLSGGGSGTVRHHANQYGRDHNAA